ncbi:MAG TPA: hemolysin family protein [Conexibacter sp.]|jgi:CBS domain containing-hemolysin-like protein|nr:hemolysin family protein [Conexibacter sp.]
MTALLLVGLLLLVAINGFFVAAEFALVRARRSRIEEAAEQGGAGARVALAELHEITEYLSACQLGITLASIGIGFLGEPAIAKLIEPAFGGLSHGVAVAISIAIAYVIVTAVHITVGEQVPKVWAIQRADRTVQRISRPLHLFARTFHPFVVLLNRASNAILRLLRVDPDFGEDAGGTPEELKLLIAESYTGGKLDAGEAGMLAGVFHLHEQEARQVMTPIPAVVTVDVSETAEAALRRCVESGHTRLVVTEDENTDRIKGLVHANSLARTLMEEGPTATIAGLVRDAPIVPETKPLDDLLADLQRQRSSLAVVVDEYGRTAGVVTVEDIVEEVVGEIADETDPTAGAVRRLPNGDWFVRGHVAVTDLEDYGLSLPVDTDAYNSVGGFVFAELGRLPKRGDTVAANGFSIRVESVRENRIEAVRISERRAA